jgi:hypothetical protein
MFLFIFLLPAAQAILFCLAIGRDPTFLKMAVVNDELDPSQGRICNYTTSCTYSMFSCRYLRFIDNQTIVQVRRESKRKATIRKRKIASSSSSSCAFLNLQLFYSTWACKLIVILY